MTVTVRPIQAQDHAAWRVLWDGYNAFYGRQGATALPEAVTAQTWNWFFDAREPVHALVAELDGAVVGIAHYLYFRSTSRLADVCYLQDLFTQPDVRGHGVGRALIEGVYAQAKAAGACRVYWGTHHTNATARLLYDQVGTNQGFIIYNHELNA